VKKPSGTAAHRAKGLVAATTRRSLHIASLTEDILGKQAYRKAVIDAISRPLEDKSTGKTMKSRVSALMDLAYQQRKLVFFVLVHFVYAHLQSLNLCLACNNTTRPGPPPDVTYAWACI
jgi:hypothetical protein